MTDCSDDIWKHYRIYYICRSTAFISAILYLFFEEYLLLSLQEILYIGGLASILYMVFKVPMGSFIDRVGEHSSLKLALIFQTLSIIPFIFTTHSTSFLFYIMCTSIADALCESAGGLLLRKSLKQDDDEKYLKLTIALNSQFYLITSLFIVFGSYLYTLDYRFPFLLQILNFIHSYYHLSKIKNTEFRSDRKKIIRETIYSTYSFFRKNSKYQFLFFCLLIYSLFSLFHRKIFQSYSKTLFDLYTPLFLGLITACSNLVCAYTAHKMSQSTRLLKKNIHYIFAITLFFIISILWTYSGSVALAVLGFFIFHAYKGFFQAFLGGELVNLFPFRHLANTHFSLLSKIIFSVSSVVQVLLVNGHGGKKTQDETTSG